MVFDERRIATDSYDKARYKLENGEIVELGVQKEAGAPMKVGIITYNYPHLKTEQIFHGLITQGYGFVYRFYALPFVERKGREVIWQHRPLQAQAAHPRELAKRWGADFIECQSDLDIDEACDIYLILGAGILSPETVRGKKILNIHPGVIPVSRGLDSFKWAIYHQYPIGNTLHYIDEKVDSGEVIAIERTPIYTSDTIATLARRHYELEMLMMIRFPHYLQRATRLGEEKPEDGILPKAATRRMSLEIEAELEARFEDYKKVYCGA